jgi:hypothetical protein
LRFGSARQAVKLIETRNQAIHQSDVVNQRSKPRLTAQRRICLCYQATRLSDVPGGTYSNGSVKGIKNVGGKWQWSCRGPRHNADDAAHGY